MLASILIVLLLASILLNTRQYRVCNILRRKVYKLDEDLFATQGDLRDVSYQLEVVSCALPVEPVFIPEHQVYVSVSNSDGVVSALSPSHGVEYENADLHNIIRLIREQDIGMTLSAYINELMEDYNVHM